MLETTCRGVAARAGQPGAAAVPLSGAGFLTVSTLFLRGGYGMLISIF